MIYVQGKEYVSKQEQLDSLVESCYDDYCYFNQMDMDTRKKFVRERMSEIKEGEMVIPYLVVQLTSKCTLNCEQCASLMPKFREGGGQRDFSWNKTKRSLEYILSQVKEITFVDLIGGEPFISPDFEEALDFVMNQKKIRQIDIPTNATVIPNDSIIEKLYQSKAIVRVSDYGLFEKMSQFVAKLDKAGVNVRIYQNMKWMEAGDVKPRGRSREEIYKQYNNCHESMQCKYLCEDHMFTCSRAAGLYNLGISKVEGDILSITDKTTKDDLLNFYLHDYGNICDYCDRFSENCKEIPAAIQVGGKQMPHSRYTVISNFEMDHYISSTKKYEQLMGRGHKQRSLDEEG